MLLLTRPNHDRTTRYISVWAQKIIDLAQLKRYKSVALDGDRAVRTVFESMLRKHQPLLIFMNGHGDANAVYGQDNQVVLEGGTNESCVSGSIVYALACSSARELGVKAVEGGALSFIGYVGDFVFVWSIDGRTRPLEDKTAEMFLDPSNQVLVSLLKGATVQEAVAHARGAFARNARKLLTSEASASDTSSLRWLLWDLQCLTVLGDKNAVIV